MKIAVLGAGVIGITTAYFLAKSGHQVIVIDRQNGAGKECSYSNGAQLSYCTAEPWATFGALKKGIKWMRRHDAPLKFRLRPELRMWLWLLKFALNCTPKKERENTKHILDLCLYSRDLLHKHETEFNFNFDHTKGGKIFVFEDKKDFLSYQKHCQLQETLGAPYQVLDKSELFNYEPALKHLDNKIFGAIRDPLDESGDCYEFCVGLENKLKEMGVEFHFETTIKNINTENKRINSVTTDKGDITADAFVMCLGTYSPLISEKIGVKMDIYPLKGYSLTVDIKNEPQAPNDSITYYGQRTVFSRIGNRMRVAGTAEFAGFNESISPERIKMMKDLTAKIFPDCGNIGTAEEWACLRPCTPSGIPIISNSKYDNLYLNTGHGPLGWTMALASAKLITDIIDKNPTGIDSKPFAL